MKSISQSHAVTSAILCIILCIITSTASPGQNNSGYGREILIKLKPAFFPKSALPLLKNAQPFSSFGLEKLDSLNGTYGCSLIKSLLIPQGGSLFKSNLKGLEEIQRIFFLRLNTSTSIQEIIENYGKLSELEYVEKNNLLYVDQSFNDPLIGEEWFLNKIDINSAWQLTHGNSSILLAIIDTGIDYTHEDLKANIWINPGEDLNHNGIVDSSDFNGIDDDQNGFVDDIQGWNFTDAPDLPDNGDYLTRDNDPMDDMGHGTSVAGLVAAVAGNGKGIAGVAPECKLLNLRAGTSQGILQEDDVSAAVLYAVLMGAKVINMSFGDVIYSNVIHDVIRFAYKNGCVTVASKGNASTANPHFPSDFAETISVGATDRNDKLASFSNFGPKMDLVAPGVDLMTTKKGNLYGNFSGTSASAPLVTGMTGLLLSQQPDLLPEQIRTALKSSAVDLGIQGMDYAYGAGRLDAIRIFQNSEDVVCYVSPPHYISGSPNQITITGSAGGQKFLDYSLYYSVYPDSTRWRTITAEVHNQVILDTLAKWDISQLPDSDYVFRLVVQQVDGKPTEMQIRFLLDRTPPVISDFSYQEFIRGTQRELFVRYETDDVTVGRVKWRYQGEGGFSRIAESPMKAQIHKIIIPLRQFSNSVEFYVEAINAAGDTATYASANNSIRFEPSAYDPPVWEINIHKTQIPPLFLMPKSVAGLNKNLIFGTIYDSNWGFENIGIFDLNGAIQQLDVHGIIRDAGDFDGDGLLDLLIGVGNKSVIYEKTDTNSSSLEFKQVWASPEEHWAARAISLAGESLPELAFRSGSNYLIYKSTGDNTYEKVAELPNPTQGDNIPGIPRVETGDFDHDGKTDLLMGDGDGDIYIYEYQGSNLFVNTWKTRLDQPNAYDLLAAGDADGDGATEFLTGCYTDPSLNNEVNPAAKYWTFSIFHTTGDNQFTEVQKWNFSPCNSLRYFDSGCASGDLDADGKNEFYLGLYPNFYVIGFNANTNKYMIFWSQGADSKNANAESITDDIKAVRSSRFVFLSPDKLLYTTEGGVQYLSKQADASGSWVMPLNFAARIIKPAGVQLSWDVPFQEPVVIQRADSNLNNFREVGKSIATFFIDSSLQTGNSYSYLLSNEAGSIKSNPVRINLHPLPKMTSSQFAPPNSLSIRFDSDMDNLLLDISKYSITPDKLRITSIEFTRGYSEVLISLDINTITQGQYTVSIDPGILDRQMAVIDASHNASSFVIPKPERELYIVSAKAVNSKTIVIEFSVPLDSQSAEDVSHYQIEPNGGIESAAFDETAASRITLLISQSHPITSSNPIITVKGLKSRNGALISQKLGNSITLFIEHETVADVFVYPNPYVSNQGGGYVTFTNLTKQATIHILTQSGRVVQVLRHNDDSGSAVWHLDDKNGRQVASGIYIYFVEGNKTQAKGKFAIIK